MAHPLASFVAGVQGGIQFKNSLADRKDDKARQKRMDEITFAREARAVEDHAFTVGERNRAMGLRDAQQADADAAYAATQASLNADGTVAAPGQPDLTASTSGTPAAAGGPATPAAQGVARAMGLDIPAPAMDNAARTMQQTMPADALGSVAAPAGAAPGPTQTAAGRLAPQRQFEPGPQQQPVSVGEWRGLSRTQRRAMGLPVSEVGMQWLRDEDGLEPSSRRTFRETREASQGRAAETRMGDRIAAGGVTRAEAGAVVGNPGSTPAPINPETVQLDPISVNQGPTKDAAARLNSERGLSAAPAAAGVAAVQGAPAASQDAAQAGAAAATDGKGFTPGQTFTPAQRKRGTSAFMDRYMEVGAPMVVEGMVKRGDIAGAMEFMKFIETAETKDAMQTWANAAIAASVGDMDGFVDGVVDLYNNQGYFPDGTSILKDQSKIVKDKDTGAPVGALITFKDEKTGNTWEQIVQADDLMALGISSFAPENAFEYWREKQKETSERTRGVQKETLDTNKQITETAIKLMEAAPIDAPLTFEEAQIKAAQALGVGSVAPSAPAGPPPVAYRP